MSNAMQRTSSLAIARAAFERAGAVDARIVRPAVEGGKETA
jgi:hypothetical protein